MGGRCLAPQFLYGERKKLTQNLEHANEEPSDSANCIKCSHSKLLSDHILGRPRSLRPRMMSRVPPLTVATRLQAHHQLRSVSRCGHETVERNPRSTGSCQSYEQS